MAQHVQNPRPSTALTEAYGLVGSVPVVLDGYVLPVALVDDLSAAGFTPTSRRVISRFNQNAVVGEYATWRLETPPNILATVKNLYIISSVATRVSVHFGSSIAAPANIAPSQFTDGRMRARGGGPAAVLSYGTQVAALATVTGFTEAVVEGNQRRADYDWTIGDPRGNYDFVEFQLAVANRSAFVCAEWIETTVP